MVTEDLIRQLRPVYGSKVDKLWNLYLSSNADQRRFIELRLRALYKKAFQDTEPILLQPPSASEAHGKYVLGKVLYATKPMHFFGLREDEWIQHLNIFGRSGAGKTNLVVVILWNLLQHGKPFMVFDWKRNYRDFLTVKGTEHVRLHTVGRKLLPFQFNPWIPPPGTATEVWMRKLIEVLCHAYFGGEGVMDVLTRAAAQAYNDNPHPTSQEVLQYTQLIPERSRQAQWKTSSLRMLRALTFAGMGAVTTTRSNDHIPTLLERQVILELDSLADSDKTLLIEALLLWIHHYRLASGRREKFLHALVIEEAHHILLKGKQELLGEAITDIVLREVREFGEAIITIDQHPSMISLPAIGNCFTTISFNLKHQTDVNTAAQCMLLHGYERQFLGQLSVGEAIVKLQGRYMKPFLIGVPLAELPKGSVSDEQLLQGVSRTRTLQLEGLDYEWSHVPETNHHIKVPSLQAAHFQRLRLQRQQNTTKLAYSAQEHPPPTQQEPVRVVPPADKQDELNVREHALLSSIYQQPLLTTLQRYEALSLSRYQGNLARQSLQTKGLVRPVLITTKQGRVVLLELAKQAKLLLNQPLIQQPSLEHQYWQSSVRQQLEQAGFAVEVEPNKNGYRPDIFATRGSETLIVEIETGKSDFLSNYQNAVSLNAAVIFILTTTEEAKKKLETALPADCKAAVRLARHFSAKEVMNG